VKRFRFPLLLLMLCAAASCAGPRESVQWPLPPEEKTVVIPSGKLGPGFKPYVINGERYYPLPDSQGFVQTGEASWYGRKFHGQPTASGETYNMYQKTAAHKTLPLGTYVRILNLRNRKQTVARVNDRGPFVKGRIIDLSYAAARDIGLVGPGVARVRVEALARQVGEHDSKFGKEPVIEARDLQRGDFTVQIGAFSQKRNALRLARRLRVMYDYVRIEVYEPPGGKTLYRLRVGRSTTLKKAAEIEKKLESLGFEEAFVVSL
jgi:peptidoglycan lytic transglycosylase